MRWYSDDGIGSLDTAVTTEVLASLLQRNVDVNEAGVDLVGNHHRKRRGDALPDGRVVNTGRLG
jgi:hypothetical protein